MLYIKNIQSDKMLFIYGTCYNNVDIIESSLNSIKDLNYEKIFITDNFSNDGTYETLNKIKNRFRIEIVRYKSKRGKGKQKSMEMAMNEANDSDYIMTIDFDVIYDHNLLLFINNIIKEEHKNCIFNNFLSLKILNKNIPWRNLNHGEDWERYAHFIHCGINVRFKNENNRNQIVSGNRERRYETGIKLSIRRFENAIDFQRGWCFKSFNSFYKRYKSKNIIIKTIAFSAYTIANIEGAYCYCKQINNREYIRLNSTSS